MLACYYPFAVVTTKIAVTKASAPCPGPAKSNPRIPVLELRRLQYYTVS